MAWPPEMAPYERLACVAKVGGFRPPDTPRTSWLGGVLLGARDETWPVGERPLWGVCQVRLDELPVAAPAALDGVALVTVFLDLVDLPSGGDPPGHRWELRTYPSLDDLVPLVEPERTEHDEWTPRMFPVRWHPRVEIPSHDELPSELDHIDDVHDCDRDGFKVGGWAATIQSAPFWDASLRGQIPDATLVLQIDSDEKTQLAIGDAGAVYIGWSPSRGWVLDWQCM